MIYKIIGIIVLVIVSYVWGCINGYDLGYKDGEDDNYFRLT